MADPGQRVVARRYLVQRELGRGGMGRVFAVLDLLENRRPGALKILRAERAGKRLDLLESMRREFAALVHLRHPNLCRVHEFGVDEENRAFFTMELIDGVDLFEAGGRSEPERLYEVAVGVLRALDYIHARGYIHHDLKPENIMLRRGVEGADAVVLTDFGLVNRDENAGFRPAEGRRTAPGTVNCLAPEILSGAPYDHRVDLYALGVSLYYAATGVYPFDADEDREVIRRHLDQPPRPPAELNPALPDPLNHLILRLLAKRPDRRFHDANTVIRAINAWAGRSFEYQTPSTAASFLLAPRIVGHGNLLDELLREVTEPFGGLISIQGEAGVGKSRLLSELRYRCQLSGTDVWFVDLSPTADPIGELIRRVAHSTVVDADLRREMGPALALRWPPLAELWEVEPAEPLEPDGERERLLRTTAALLDDLGRAAVFDGDTSGFLEPARELGQLCRRVPIILSTEVNDPPGRVYHITTLDENQVGELIESMLGVVPPRGLVSFVYRTAGGNPLFVTETLRGLIDAGLLRRRHGSWEADLLEAGTMGVPAAIAELTLRRVAGLSPEARATAEVIALAAWKPTTEELEALVEEPAKLADSLRELGTWGMLQIRYGNRPTLATAHLSRTLRDHCGRAPAIHDRLTGYLESKNRLFAPYDYHRLYGTDRERAVPAGLGYVGRMLELRDHSEARRALAHLRSIARADDLTRVELLTSKVSRRLGDAGRATAAAFRALERSRGGDRGEAYLELGKATACQGRHLQAMGYYDAALSCAEDSALKLRTGAERVKALIELGRFDEALSLGKELALKAKGLGHLEGWFVREVYGRALFHAGRLAEAEHAYEALYRQSLEADHLVGQWSAGRGRGLTQLSLNQKRRGLALLRNSCWMAIQSEDTLNVARAAVPLSLGYLLNLRPRRAVAVLKLGRNTMERRSVVPLQVELSAALSAAYRYRGDLGRAAHYAGRATAFAEGLESARLRWTALYCEGAVRIELGAWRAVEEVLDSLSGAPSHLTALLRGRLAWERGDFATARRELLSVVGETPPPVALPEWDSARGYLARAELELGNLSSAEELLVPSGEEEPSDLGGLEERFALVELYLGQGETEYSMELLRRAVKASGGGGLVDHMRRGLHLAAKLAARRNETESRSRLLKEAKRLLRWMVHRLPRGTRDGFLARRGPTDQRAEGP
jgi:serine/threonine protein kinase/tetratricopeptide (TPR) repeat protein